MMVDESNCEDLDGSEAGEHNDSFFNANDAEIVGDDDTNVEGSDYVQNEEYAIDSLEDIGRTQIWNLQDEEILKFHFGNLSLAFEFYNRFAKHRGFGARKSKARTNTMGIRVIQTFVCSCEGYRPLKYYRLENRKKEPRAERRCGCTARMKVRLDRSSGRWEIIDFSDDHNHKCLEPRFHGMLATHRKMTNADIMQMNSMRCCGISTTKIYGSIASQSGGYQFVRFNSRDMYNQVAKQRRVLAGDANSALQFLRQMTAKHNRFYFQHTINEDGTLHNLFWCDGVSRRDYMVFGDVLAFDATYKKNKYGCPLVVFSGVNHHNMTVVFAAALISNEIEETYVWLLEKFLEAMEGKPPVSVITDGDLAMRNAIREVFPNAHHRLCAWHLIRNATSNVRNPRFLPKFKMCMLGDLEIGAFRKKWDDMVQEFGLEDNRWIQDMYEKREMWATAYIRGKFFAGFRTTSRCEGLHAVLSKYVRSQYNFTDFLIHFQRCLENLRHNEVWADFKSADGVPVMLSSLEPLERFAADVYTRHIFFLFRPYLYRVATLRFIEVKETGSYVIYVIGKYGKPNVLWHVCYCEEPIEFKCSCLRMESLGIPCEHIIAVVVRLDLTQLPKCLVLDRWTKEAKSYIGDEDDGAMFGSVEAARFSALVDGYHQLATLACGRANRFIETRDAIYRDIARYKNEDAQENNETEEVTASHNDILRNPRQCRAKGRSRRNSQRCGVCRHEGHNRKTCTAKRNIDNDLLSIDVESLGMDDLLENENLGYNDATEDCTSEWESCANLSHDN